MLLPPGLDQLEERAREHLSEGAWGYFSDAARSDAAEQHTTAAHNERAWRRWYLRPRVLVDVSAVDTSTSVLGTAVRAPVLLAPCAFNAFAHPEAERAVARAAERAGALQVVSTASSVPPPEVARSSAAPKWLQLYSDVDRAQTDLRLRAAEEAGFLAIVLTVDTPVGSPRYRGYPEQGFGPVATGAVIDPRLDWKEVERIAATTRLPLVLKGILHPEDARLAVESGAAAVAVSNHGGRQLDGAIPTALALPAIADAVAGRIEVYVDGGVRSARDVLRALALGARAVMIGRPYVWALAIAGEAGVEELLVRLREELHNAMMLAGQTDATRIPRDLVVAAAPGDPV
jgi:isopentenyl diphosphate isomerase/L-lactate dehydrogenase-like FMN-dependent dehydrogenase